MYLTNTFFIYSGSTVTIRNILCCVYENNFLGSVILVKKSAILKWSLAMVGIGLLLLSVISSAAMAANETYYIATKDSASRIASRNIFTGLLEGTNEEDNLLQIIVDTECDLKNAYMRAVICNAGVIVASKDDFNIDAYKYACENSDIRFIVFGGKILPSKMLKNLFAVSYNETKASFIAGYTATYTTKLRSVALLISEEYTSFPNEVANAFLNGVRTASKEKMKDTTVAIYTAEHLPEHKFTEELVSDIYKKGADVLFVASSDGIYAAHKATLKANKKIILVKETSQLEWFPSDNCVLATVDKNNINVMNRVFREIENNRYEQGQNIIIPFKKGEFGFTVNHSCKDESVVDTINNTINKLDSMLKED